MVLLEEHGAGNNKAELVQGPVMQFEGFQELFSAFRKKQIGERERE